MEVEEVREEVLVRKDVGRKLKTAMKIARETGGY